MLKVLVAVDGSPSSNRAVDHVIKLKEAEGKMELHIINVQIPIESGHARMFVSGDDHRFDKIIMGSHGQHALTHMLLGPVASDVVRSSDISVTLVK